MTKKIPSEFGNFVKTQGKHREFFAQVVNSLILKVKDNSIYVQRKISYFFLKRISLPSQFCGWNSHKSRKLAQGKFTVGQGINRENTANLKMQLVWVPCMMRYLANESNQLKPHLKCSR